MEFLCIIAIKGIEINHQLAVSSQTTGAINMGVPRKMK